MLEGIPNASYSEYDLLKTYRGQSRKKKLISSDNISDVITDSKKEKPELELNNDEANKTSLKSQKPSTAVKPDNKTLSSRDINNVYIKDSKKSTNIKSRNSDNSTNKEFTNSEKNVSKKVEPARRSTRAIKPNSKYLDV